MRRAVERCAIEPTGHRLVRVQVMIYVSLVVRIIVALLAREDLRLRRISPVMLASGIFFYRVPYYARAPRIAPAIVQVRT